MTVVVVVVVTGGFMQDAEDARRDEEERAHRSDQMRKDRAAVRLITYCFIYLLFLCIIRNFIIYDL